MTQEKALEILKSGKSAFLTGEPGSGKTFTVNQYIQYCHQIGRKVAITASTGIAATHSNGITIHSWCAMGIKDVISDTDIAMIMTKQYAVDQMNEAKVLIIDEISMLAAKQIDNIDRILKHVRMNGFEPFGGIQVIFVGDFFQLPPVTRGKELVKFAYDSEAWKQADLSVCYLTEQHRQSDKSFLDILSAMRSGTMNDRHISTLVDCSKNEKQKTKLFTHNVEVDSLNVQELQKVDGEERVYEMMSQGNDYLVSMLKKQCMSPERLVVRVGAVVMFTRNNFEEGYVNGTLGRVVGYENGMPVVVTNDGQTIYVKYAEWSIEDTRTLISQVPLRLAWAITVHKSQGMSLDGATIDLSKCFEYGQGYVALSRVRSLAGICLEGMNKRAILTHPAVIEKDKEFRNLSKNNE